MPAPATAPQAPLRAALAGPSCRNPGPPAPDRAGWVALAEVGHDDLGFGFAVAAPGDGAFVDD